LQGSPHIGHAANGAPVDRRDDVALLQAGVVGGASGYHLRDARSTALRLFGQHQPDEGSPEPWRHDLTLLGDSLNAGALVLMALAEDGRGGEEAVGRGQAQGQHPQGQ
jgi:hypothetical protein